MLKKLLFITFLALTVRIWMLLINGSITYVVIVDGESEDTETGYQAPDRCWNLTKIIVLADEERECSWLFEKLQHHSKISPSKIKTVTRVKRLNKLLQTKGPFNIIHLRSGTDDDGPQMEAIDTLAKTFRTPIMHITTDAILSRPQAAMCKLFTFVGCTCPAISRLQTFESTE
eukprot:TRINITY_DN9611_c0_g1_i1.p1 TRINITY_DN9611_c0_g1~~TRINITY_DN9611_c0_g1_i1.p1  ORF type:complete len:173 (-),score=9.37 TRINITY_DN9611_c0_g1_i1:98-616(-)